MGICNSNLLSQLLNISQMLTNHKKKLAFICSTCAGIHGGTYGLNFNTDCFQMTLLTNCRLCGPSSIQKFLNQQTLTGWSRSSWASVPTSIADRHSWHCVKLENEGSKQKSCCTLLYPWIAGVPGELLVIEEVTRVWAHLFGDWSSKSGDISCSLVLELILIVPLCRRIAKSQTSRYDPCIRCKPHTMRLETDESTLPPTWSK